MRYFEYYSQTKYRSTRLTHSIQMEPLYYLLCRILKERIEMDLLRISGYFGVLNQTHR